MPGSAGSAGGHLVPVPWSMKRTLIGMAFALSAFVLTSAVFSILAILFVDHPALRDVGDIFTKAGEVATYADKELAAAAADKKIPEPPTILADLRTVEIGFATTLLYEVMLVAIVGMTSGRDLRGLAAVFGLDRFRWDRLWVPVLCVFGAYAMVIAYALVVRAIGIGFLEPQSSIPPAVTREPSTLALAGVLAVIAAPIAEEFFFRGLVFGGFLRWGFWPSALISATLFSLAHFDPGSVIPFTGVGLIMAWLFWRQGRLWDSIIFHAMFNFASFVLLASG